AQTRIAPRWINIFFDHIECKIVKASKRPDRYREHRKRQQIRMLQEQDRRRECTAAKKQQGLHAEDSFAFYFTHDSLKKPCQLIHLIMHRAGVCLFSTYAPSWITKTALAEIIRRFHLLWIYFPSSSGT